MFIFCSSTKKVTLLPFYGGAKGQSLQIIEYSDGRIETVIVKNPNAPIDTPAISVNTSELENPVLPSIYELSDFGSNIKKIQDSALKVVKLQEMAKKKGELSESEEALHKENLEILNQSAQNLAELQEELHPFDFEGREGLSSWFERKGSKDKKKKEEEKKRKEEEKKRKEEEERKRKEEEKKKKEEEKRKKEEYEKKKKEEEEEKRRKEEYEKKKKEEEEERKRKENEERKQEETDKGKEEEKRKEQENEKEVEAVIDEDAVEVNLPQEDASVAEAKPVGLAVAGNYFTLSYINFMLQKIRILILYFSK